MKEKGTPVLSQDLEHVAGAERVNGSSKMGMRNHPPFVSLSAGGIAFFLACMKVRFSFEKKRHRRNQKKRKKAMCVARESNPDQLLGRQLC